MEHFQGRPVWHCSISRNGKLPTLLDYARSRLVAEAILAGCGEGDTFEEIGRGVLHVRKYTTAEESAMVGGAVDVRGTDEHRRRVDAVREYLPQGWLEMIGEAP